MVERESRLVSRSAWIASRVTGWVRSKQDGILFHHGRLSPSGEEDSFTIYKFRNYYFLLNMVKCEINRTSFEDAAQIISKSHVWHFIFRGGNSSTVPKAMNRLVAM